MPNRIIRDSIRTSESLSRLTDAEARHFFLLITYADDHGRLDARPSVIRAMCYSLMLSTVSEEEVERRTQRLADPDVDILRLYAVDGKPYGEFRQWSKYQRVRAKESKFPGPPPQTLAADRKMQTSADINDTGGSHDQVGSIMSPVVVVEDVNEGGNENEDEGGNGVGDGDGITVSKDPALENPPEPEPLAAPIPSATASNPYPKVFKPPDYWSPLTTLEGYARRDHSRFVATLEATCAAQGVSPGDVVTTFAEYYAGNRFRHGWSDPVAALRRTLSLQIAKLHGRNKSPPYQTAHERRIAAEKAIPIRPITQV